jgi:signal transduction histidine kinase
VNAEEGPPAGSSPDVALASFEAALADAVTAWEVARAITTRALPLLGADAATLHAVRGGRRLELVLAQEGAGAGAQLVPLRGAARADRLVATAFRRGAVWISDPAELAACVPGGPLPEALAALPVVTSTRTVIGVLALAWRRSGPPGAPARALAQAVADRCAIALRRALRHEGEQRARVAAEAELVTARRQAHLQDHLMAVVGHDLRTPLQTVIMGTRLLQRADLASAHAATLARMQRSTERAAVLIRDLLDLGRVRQGLGLRIVRREANLAEICCAEVLELQQAYPGRALDAEAEGDGRGEWDPERLAQVVANLVGNAIVHGGARAHVVARVDGSGVAAVRLDVWNDGPVIPPARLARIFEPFDGTPDPGDPSPGIGLAIVREIVRAHGGAMSVRSSAGEGTAFEVVLPRRPPGR